jgi:glutamate racemase
MTKLAILDWGIGGIDFYRILKKNNPGAGVCYFSDAGAVPYGKQQKGQLLRRLGLVTEFLKRQGTSHLVVACNAMSTVLPEAEQSGGIAGLHITGVIEPTLSAVLDLGGNTVGVVGGRRTILSGAYAKPLRRRFPTVTQRIAQPLSALIESGEKDTALFRDTLTAIMKPLVKSDILILACTHYPAALDAFQPLTPDAVMINPSDETFRWVSENWHIENNAEPDAFYTTGDPEMMRCASKLAFGVQVGKITQITM